MDDGYVCLVMTDKNTLRRIAMQRSVPGLLCFLAKYLLGRAPRLHKAGFGSVYSGLAIRSVPPEAGLLGTLHVPHATANSFCYFRCFDFNSTGA
jgi:hypothetical protein